jgi:hypothetical protein
MAKNMRRNQGAGREKGAPRLVHRKIGAPIAYCCKAATLPTKTMLHVFLTAATQRMRTAWGAVRWERYFRQTYTYTERLSAENAAAYGVGSLLLARWHYGMASGCVPGMGANNWQLTEGGHRFFKEPVKKRARNLKEVVEIYEEMIKRQTGPAHDEEKSYSRMGLPDCIATVPTRPDAWMMESGMIAKSPWHTSAMYLPSIRTYVDAYNEGRDASSPRVHMYVINDRVKAYVMRIGLPRPISRSFAKQLVWHLRTKRVDTLRTRWVAAGILEEQTTTEAQPGGVAPATDARNSSASGSSDDGTSDSASDDDEELRAGDDEGYEAAPSDAAQGSDGRRDAVDSATEPDAAKINMSVLGEQWGQHCVVMMVGDRARGTCFYACKTGHCQHKYTAMQLEEWPGADYTGEKIVDAKAGAAADRHGLVGKAQRVPSDRAAKESARKTKNLLGHKSPDVPESVRAVMEALAREGSIPISTLQQRSSCRSMKGTQVPAQFTEALRYKYVHHSLPCDPPVGFQWVQLRGTWRLLPRA